VIGIAQGVIRRYRHLNWVFLDQAVVSGTNFATMVLVARHLGIEEFGRFAMAWAVLLAVFNLQYALVLSPLMSIGSKLNGEEMPWYFGAVVAQQIALSVLSFALLWMGTTVVATLFPAWRLDGLALPLVFASLTYQIHELFRRYFFTVRRYAVSTAMDCARCAIQLLLLIWLFKTAMLNSAGVLAVIGAAFAIASLLGSRSLGGITWDMAAFRVTTHRHWHFSKWLVASALIQWVTGNVFLVSTGAVLGVAAAGALKAVQNITNVTNILFEAISNVAPIQAGRNLSTCGFDALHAYILRLMLWSGLATLAVLLPAAVAPNWILNIIYGRQFAGFGWVLVWFAGLTLIASVGQSLQYALTALEQTKSYFVSRLLAALLGISTALPVAVTFGLPGVMGGITVLTLVLVAIPGITYLRVRQKSTEFVTVLPPYQSE